MLGSGGGVGVLGLIGALAVALSACAASGGDGSGMLLPPVGGQPDYQLGEAYDPPAGVDIVARDRTADPVGDAYSICYVNGFQTQPGEVDLWPADALLHRDGELVEDPGWPDEFLLDTSTDRARGLIVETVEPWIRGCAADGFDAVEFDNLDTYTRSDGALDRDGNVALAAELVRVAHESGLAAGQKNAVEDAALLRERAGFDFAVVEECAAYDECGALAEVYGDQIVAIEYSDTLDRPFADVCADDDRPASIVLRDRRLVGPESPDYVFELC